MKEQIPLPAAAHPFLLQLLSPAPICTALSHRETLHEVAQPVPHPLHLVLPPEQNVTRAGGSEKPAHPATASPFRPQQQCPTQHLKAAIFFWHESDPTQQDWVGDSKKPRIFVVVEISGGKG